VKKKVLFMITRMNIGGVEKSLLSLLSVFPKEQFDITILFLQKQGGFLNNIPEGVKMEEANWFGEIWKIISQPPPDTLKEYIRKRKYVKAFAFGLLYFLSRELNNHHLFYRHVFKTVPKNRASYDIAISYQGPTDIIDYYIAHKVKAEKKVSWVHFDVSKHHINVSLYERLYKKFDKIFVVSNEAKNQLEKKIPGIKNKTEVFMNIVSKKLNHELSNKPVAFDDDYKGIRIVTVGRLSLEKGQDMAIKVLAKLRKHGINARWYCVGDGSAREIYEQLIRRHHLENDFILLGPRVNPYPYIAKCDIYVQTSRHEGYCLALAEAKCLHKPIVTTNFIGAYEQITDGYNGWIVKDSEEELFDKIMFLIENPLHQNSAAFHLSTAEMDTTREVDKLVNLIKV
jgi:glycosyltransferase involved in cell wall biosynthesis